MNYENMAKELMSIMEKSHKATRHIREPLGGEAFVLYQVSRSVGSITPSDISCNIGVSTARVATTLKNLEKKEMIVREIDKDDRRKILIKITEKGKEEVEKNYNHLLNNTIEMLVFLGEDDANEFIRIKKRLAQRNKELAEKCSNKMED